MRLLLSLFILVCSSVFLSAQEVDSLIQPSSAPALLDSTQTAIQSMAKPKPRKLAAFFRRQLVDDYPNPRKALLLGLVIPGSGQAYNGSFWKVPIVVGAIGSAIYNIDRNRRNYFLFRDAYKARVNGETDPFVNIYTQSSQLKTIRDSFRKSYELSWIAMFGVGILSAAEAFVDAHLSSFDVSDDLTWKPKFKLGNDQLSGTYVGIGLAFQFK